MAIGLVGFLFLLVSLLFGEVFEHFDFGHVDHDIDGGPTFFSVRGIAVFITAFGAFGAIATNLGYTALPSSAFGFAGGLVLATIVYFFARFLYGQQASSTISSSDLVGRTAQVSVAIPANGVGQIRCLIGESMVDKIAQTRDGSAITHNALVTIEEIVGEFVIVSPAGAPKIEPKNS